MMKTIKKMGTSISKLDNTESSAESPQRQNSKGNIDLELIARTIGKRTAYFTIQILRDFNINLDKLDKARYEEILAMLHIDLRTAYTKTEVAEYGTFARCIAKEHYLDLNTSSGIYKFMNFEMKDLDVEQFHILLMDRSYELIDSLKISQDGVDDKSVDDRIIMREVLLNNASILAVCHNRPSGIVRPRKSDDELTMCIKNDCEILGIHFHDHIIVAGEKYYSYRDHGKL